MPTSLWKCPQQTMWAANDRLSLPQWLLCVTNPIWTLAILSKKKTFKEKGSFLSKFRLCTGIESACFSPVQIDWLNPLHAVLQNAKWFWVFCWDRPSIQVHHSTRERIPLFSTKQRVQNIHLWAHTQVLNPDTTDVSFSVSAAPA